MLRRSSTLIYEPDVGLKVVVEFVRGKVPPELMTGGEEMNRRSESKCSVIHDFRSSQVAGGVEAALSRL